MIVIDLDKRIDKKSFIKLTSKHYNAAYPFHKWEKIKVFLDDRRVYAFIGMMSSNKKRRFSNMYCIEIPLNDYNVLLRDGKIKSIC